MATVAPLGAFQEVSLPQGTLRYYEQGTGPTLVFIHGLLANSLLWSWVIPRLVLHFRCLAPDLPLGAHSRAFVPLDQPEVLAQQITEFVHAEVLA